MCSPYSHLSPFFTLGPGSTTLYSGHTLRHGLISSTTLYNTLQSTALQQFYSLQPLQPLQHLNLYNTRMHQFARGERDRRQPADESFPGHPAWLPRAELREGACDLSGTAFLDDTSSVCHVTGMPRHRFRVCMYRFRAAARPRFGVLRYMPTPLEGDPIIAVGQIRESCRLHGFCRRKPRALLPTQARKACTSPRTSLLTRVRLRDKIHYDDTGYYKSCVRDVWRKGVRRGTRKGRCCSCCVRSDVS